MPKKKRSRAFWKNFKFKYKVTIVNENTLEEIVGLRVSKLNGLSVLLCVWQVLFLIAACIIAFTPLRNYLPGYMNSEVPYANCRQRPAGRLFAASTRQAESVHHEYTGYF